MATTPTSRPTWNNSLAESLARLHKPSWAPRLAILGIGQELRGDDAAGVFIARMLAARAPATDELPLLLLDAGAMPENCTGLLRRFRPDLVLLIDAAQMDLEPGAVRWLDCDSIVGCSACTHALPLDILAHYLEAELGCRVALLGIQPADIHFDTNLSPAVRTAVDAVVDQLFTTCSRPYT